MVLRAAVACGSNDAPLTPAAATTAVKAGTAIDANAPGGPWRRLSARGPGMISSRCGDARRLLGVPGVAPLDEAVAPSLSSTIASSRYPLVSLDMRLAVLAYSEDADARAAMGRIGKDAFTRCLVAAINDFLDHRGPVDFEAVGHATAESFRTTQRSVPGGDSATQFDASFGEHVLGGFDNSNEVPLFVVRSGPFVVTASH